MARDLYVAWQDGNTRAWRTVARLSRVDDEYELAFTEGARKVEKLLSSLFGLDPNYKYRFKDLLSAFKNKLPPKSRADYQTLAGWFGVDGTETDFELLSKFGVMPSNDPIIVYPEPTCAGDEIEFEFFLHSVRYMHPDAISWCKNAKLGSCLLPMLDIKNEADHCAVALRSTPGSIILGYVPAFLVSDIKTLLMDKYVSSSSQIVVSHVNPNAPAQMMVKCKFSSKVPYGFSPFGADNYKIIAQ